MGFPGPELNAVVYFEVKYLLVVQEVFNEGEVPCHVIYLGGKVIIKQGEESSQGFME